MKLPKRYCTMHNKMYNDIDRAKSLQRRSRKPKTKNQPKEEVFGTDIPRTSGGHSRGYPDPKLRSGQSKSWKNKHLGADIHDPKARTSMTLREFQKLRSEKLRADFSCPRIERTRKCWQCEHFVRRGQSSHSAFQGFSKGCRGGGGTGVSSSLQSKPSVSTCSV